VGPAENYFRDTSQGLGWSGAFKTIGYYRGDTGTCDVQFYSGATGNQHVAKCDTYFFDTSAEGTNNQDLRNLACQLAWYIYNNYTLRHKNVLVVAHSMGGLIIRYALHWVYGGSYGHSPAFPPELYVPTVVTFATPNGGIPSGVGPSLAVTAPRG